ncbi:MAG: hypothetical protein M3550_05215 [Actinomycetota bacterium]|nr:hypothetical protein [Actinomycetota bacterium]
MNGSVILAMSDFLDSGSGPDQTGDFRVSPTFFLIVLALGFVVGVFGHIIESKTLVAMGIGLVFSATVALPVVVALSN